MRTNTKGGQTVSFELNNASIIAASDAVDVAVPGSLIHCNKTGNYNLLLTGMEAPVVFFLNAGISYPLRIKRLYATDTDHADGLVALLSVLEE